MVIWFDVEFSKRFCSQQPVTLSTSPFAPSTHWAQTVLPLRWVATCYIRLIIAAGIHRGWPRATGQRLQ